MNSFVGPFRLMIKEMSMTFYINATITFVLFIFFNLLGVFDVAKSGIFFLHGPLFIVFLLYPFINFKGYQYILSFCGTRKQFVFAFYLSSLIYGAISILLLNLFYYLSKIINANNTIEFFHLANIVNDSNLLMELWIDFTWLIFVFSLGIIAKTIWFNYGTLFTLSLATFLIIAVTIVALFAEISKILDVIFDNYMLFIVILFGLSFTFLLISYLLMRNAPLEKGNRVLIRQSTRTT
ncbi:hypothetical protein LG296_09055 [Ureibacillus chungkukjangi]|uniref:hypothetical protein n=1 Tax=Ureibacillus chungkukjangi TaxID=1202712 RepID=UPI00384F211C